MKSVGVLLIAVFAFGGGACEYEECSARPVPIRGDYQLEPRVGGPTLLTLRQAAMHVAEQRVTVEYQRADGARFRATYRISKRGKTTR